MVNRVLYPGRFQPFHLGHLNVVEDLFRKFDEVVIAIGSAQEGFTCRNPFTAGERMEMIRETLLAVGVDPTRLWLIPVPDLNKPLAWTSYLLGLSPSVKAVATGNPHVAYLYKWLGLKVINIKPYNPEIYNGSNIRMLIAKGLEWEHCVHSITATYIKKIGGVERIRTLCSS